MLGSNIHTCSIIHLVDSPHFFISHIHVALIAEEPYIILPQRTHLSFLSHALTDFFSDLPKLVSISQETT